MNPSGRSIDGSYSKELSHQIMHVCDTYKREVFSSIVWRPSVWAKNGQTWNITSIVGEL